jgi:hypothetical protein
MLSTTPWRRTRVVQIQRHAFCTSSLVYSRVVSFTLCLDTHLHSPIFYKYEFQWVEKCLDVIKRVSLKASTGNCIPTSQSIVCHTCEKWWNNTNLASWMFIKRKSYVTFAELMKCIPITRLLINRSVSSVRKGNALCYVGIRKLMQVALCNHVRGVPGRNYEKFESFWVE